MDWLAQAMGHHQRGELTQAELLYREGLRSDPQHPDVLHLLGVLTAQRGDCAAGAALIRQALTAQPGTAVFAQNLAGILVNLSTLQRQQADYTGAAQSLREAIQLVPEHWQARVNLGNLLAECGRSEEAETHLRAARLLEPVRADVAYSLGSLLLRRGLVTESEALLRQSLSDPALTNATLCNLAQCLKDQGRVEEALACYEEALQRQPEWPEVESNRLNLMTYSAELSAEAVVEAHRAWGQEISRRMACERSSCPLSRWDGHRKLRIGYGSPDFRRHAVSYLFEPLLKAHDRSHFEFFCYAYTRQSDEVTARLQAYGDTWRCLDGLPDREAAALIRRDELDVFVDLAGHTAGNRLRLLAFKPAPVLATYLGYSHTTGLPEIDYRITDAAAEPPGTESLHNETLIRLPRSLLCYQPPEAAPEVSPLPAKLLGRLTFGSLNRLDKVNEPTLARWGAVLRRCTGSHLLLKATPFADPAFRAQFLARLAGHGIDAQRVEFAENNQPVAVHLRQFHGVDISLDTHPFSGSTTTMESLWMGVPVVTLTGPNSMSRMSASFLHAAGLDRECIASSESEFVEKACTLAADLDALETLRASLRARIEASDLRHPASFAHAMESAYETMVRERNPAPEITPSAASCG